MRDLKKQQKAAHKRKLAAAKNLRSGTKPPDPPPVPTTAPGAGVDAWRESK